MTIMTTHKSDYHLLPADDAEAALTKQHTVYDPCRLVQKGFRSVSVQTITTVLLFSSIIFNIVQFLGPSAVKEGSLVVGGESSPYGLQDLLCVYSSNCTNTCASADIRSSLERPFRWTTAYSSVNSTDLDSLWYEQIPWESGIIALENTEATRMRLPPSQPFPWDPARKGIYIVNGHHVLHCVVRTELLT